MPTIYGDHLPDIAGRSLGSALRPWGQLHVMDIFYYGTLQGPAGAAIGSFSNSTPDIDTLLVESDSGMGGMLTRFRMGNESGAAETLADFRNLDHISFGHEDSLVSGGVPLWLRHPAGSTKSPLVLFDQGASVAGRRIFQLGNLGEAQWRHSANGWAHQIYVEDEAQPRYLVTGDGQVRFGPGGATATDAGIRRHAPGVMRIAHSTTLGDLELRQLIASVAAPTPPFVVVSNAVVANLNADLLDGNDWASPGALGAVARNSGLFTTIGANGQISSTLGTGTAPLAIASTTPVDNLTVRRADSLVVQTGLSNNGSGVKHKRQTTGSIAAGGFIEVQVNWTTAFADANYTAIANVLEATTTGDGLTVERIVAITATHIIVQVHNKGSGALTGTLHCVGLHD